MFLNLLNLLQAYMEIEIAGVQFCHVPKCACPSMLVGLVGLAKNQEFLGLKHVICYVNVMLVMKDS